MTHAWSFVGISSGARADWPVRRVGDLVDLVNGHPFDSTTFGPVGDMPLVRIRDLLQSDFETYVTGEVPDRVVLREHDVVIGMDGDFNVMRWSRGPAALNQRLCLLRPKRGVDIRFIYYSLPASLRVLNDLAYSTTVKHLSSNEILAERIRLPTFDEQRRIADFLDDQVSLLDRAIGLRQQQIELLGARQRVYASQALSGGLSREPLVVDPTFGLARADWPVLKLRRVLTQSGVGVVVNPSSYFADEGVPFVHGTNVRDGWLDLTSVKRITQATSDSLPRSRLQGGDVVVMRVGYPGRAAVVPDELTGGNCASVLLLRPAQSVILPQWLAMFFNSPQGRMQVDKVQYGAAQGVVNLGDVAEFFLPVPSLAEQAEILDEVGRRESATRQAVLLMAEATALLLERKQALITAAVTGEFDVTTARGVA